MTLEDKIIIVLGMHRSGTSVVSNWLQMCGVNIGTDLLEGTSYSNPMGHFEDRAFLELHKEFLVSRYIDKNGLLGIPDSIELNRAEKENINRLILKKKKNKNIWGWKDPRTCLFLDTYQELIPQAFYIIVFRNPTDVVHSLYTRSLKIYYHMLKKGSINAIVFLRYLIKWIFKKNEIHKQYLNTWILYNQKIINAILNNKINDYLIFNIDELEQIENMLFNELHRRFPTLKKHPISSIYHEELLSRNKPININLNAKEMFDKLKMLSITNEK